MSTLRWSVFVTLSMILPGSVGAAVPDMTVEIAPVEEEARRYWPRWRGPSGQGVVEGSGYVDRWSPGENVLWKVEIPGSGASSPIVWQDKIFLTTSEDRGRRRSILCLRRSDGRLLWRADAPETDPESVYRKNTHASSTPTTDGKLVYAYFGNHGLIAVDFDGNLRWHRSFGDVTSRHGTAGSPFLYRDRIILYQDHNGPKGSFVAAFDTATGKRLWRTGREEKWGWGSPIVIQAGDRAELIVSGQDLISAYNPDNGKRLWRARGNLTEVTPTPVAGEGLLFCSSGRAGPTLAIRPGGKGDVTDSHVVWKSTKGSPFVPSPLLYEGRLYLINDMVAIATSIDARSGRILWQGRIGTARREGFSSSPIVVDDKLFLTNDEGETFVVGTGDRFELLHVNQLGERTLASPALVDGTWYWRTAKHLLAIGESPAGGDGGDHAP